VVDKLKLVGIGTHDGISKYRGKFQVGLADVKYFTYTRKQSQEGNLKDMKQKKRNSFMHSDNIKST
jgi:hypothetical protein